MRLTFGVGSSFLLQFDGNVFGVCLVTIVIILNGIFFVDLDELVDHGVRVFELRAEVLDQVWRLLIELQVIFACLLLPDSRLLLLANVVDVVDRVYDLAQLLGVFVFLPDFVLEFLFQD